MSAIDPWSPFALYDSAPKSRRSLMRLSGLKGIRAAPVNAT
jgi:hypothetical protein